MTIHQITDELTTMENFVVGLDKGNLKDLQVLSETLIDLASQLARSASLVADAEQILAKAKRQAYLNYVASSKSQGYKHSPSLVKDFVSSKFDEELRCAVYADRINKALTHSGEWIRSIMSATKTELQTLHYQRG